MMYQEDPAWSALCDKANKDEIDCISPVQILVYLEMCGKILYHCPPFLGLDIFLFTVALWLNGLTIQMLFSSLPLVKVKEQEQKELVQYKYYGWNVSVSFQSQHGSDTPAPFFTAVTGLFPFW